MATKKPKKIKIKKVKNEQAEMDRLADLVNNAKLEFEEQK